MTATIHNNRIGNGVAGSGASCGGACNGIFINPRQGGFMDLEVIGNIIQNASISERSRWTWASSPAASGPRPTSSSPAT